MLDEDDDDAAPDAGTDGGDVSDDDAALLEVLRAMAHAPAIDPEERAQPQPGQDARVSSDEGRSRIPLKECSSSGPQRPERDRPDLLQGGGVALMFGGPVGDWPINEPKPPMNPKASKLG